MKTQGEGQGKIKTEIKVMLLHARKHQRLPENPWKLGERPGRDSPSQPSEGMNSADTLILDFQPPEILDFQPPELCKNTFLLSKPPSLWHFVTSALTNKSTICQNEGSTARRKQGTRM